MSEIKKPREFYVFEIGEDNSGYRLAEDANSTETIPFEIGSKRFKVIEKSAFDRQQAVIAGLLKSLEEIRWSWENDAGRQCDNIAHEAMAKAKRDLENV
ncbi:MAG: hypothetical protein IPQ08_06315 [Chitinophagaceae bacterium]|nr:hypothetical protein [Chitinophagaceae bacterium]